MLWRVQVSRWLIRTTSQTESNIQAFIDSLRQGRQEAKKKTEGLVPFFSTECHQARSGRCSADGSLNTRFLPLHKGMGPRNRQKGLQVDKYSAKVEKSASATAPN